MNPETKELIDQIHRELMGKVEVRPYNKESQRDGNFNYIHQEFVADALIKIKGLL